MKKLFIVLLFSLVSIGLYAQQENLGLELVKQAARLYQNHQLHEAEALLEDCIKSSQESHVIESAKELLDKVQNDIHKINVSSPSYLNISPEGGFKEMNVSSLSKWEVLKKPEWCAVVDKSDVYLKLWFDRNPRPVSRTDDIILSTGSQTISMTVHQDQGEAARGSVFFRTVPDDAELETSDGVLGHSSIPHDLASGKFKVRVSKEGYEYKDTVVTVHDTDSILVVDVNLIPKFGKLKPIVLNADGVQIQDVDFKIGMTSVDIYDYANARSFDDRSEIRYCSFYKEGVIPLMPRQDIGYHITVSAKDYREQEAFVKIAAGETKEVRFVLESVSGRLLLENKGSAENAQVYIPELRSFIEIGDTLNLPVGEYNMLVRKKHHQLTDGSDHVQAFVEKGKLTIIPLRMNRVADIFVSTVGGGERVSLNGKLQEFTDPEHHLKIPVGVPYRLEVSKPGHWKFVDEFSAGPSDTLFDYRGIKLQKTSLLNISADQGSLVLTMFRKDTLDGIKYVDSDTLKNVKLTKKQFLIPNGKYKVILERQSPYPRQKLAYKGTINFKGESDSKSFRTWKMTTVGNIFSFEADYAFHAQDSKYVATPLNASFFEFRLVPGLSAYMAKAKLVDLRNFGKTSNKNNPVLDLMPAISPLMNFDFRIGGGIARRADINAVFSYAHYINFEKWFPERYSSFSFNHLSGHDIFFGLEFGSRWRFSNLYFRTGVQHLIGNAGYALRSDHMSFQSKLMSYTPLSQTSYVMSVGVDFMCFSKGRNVLRLF